MTSASFLARHGILAAVIFIISAVSVTAYPGGRFGSYQAGCGGFGCHGAQSANTVVTLEGPRTLRSNQQGNYQFLVANPNNDYAGFNAAFRSATGNVGTLTAGQNSQAQGGEVTHTGPTQENAVGQVVFGFTWQAPADHGTYTFYGAGNSVNYNGNADNGDVWNTTGAITITVQGATITAPAAGAAICVGNNLTMNWTQTGFTNFRIDISDNEFNTFTTIVGNVAATAGTSTWAIPAAQPAGQYKIRLWDVGTAAEISRSNAFTINGAPTITTQPETKTICEGTPWSISVATNAGGATYQWRRNGQVIAGATNPTYSQTIATAASAGTYDCQVTSCGQSVTSNAAEVTTALSPGITKQPTPVTACQATPVTLTVEAVGTGLTYQWVKNGEPLSGKTTPTLTIPSVALTDEGKYACRVTGVCTPQAISTEVDVNVTEAPGIVTQPTNKNVLVGDSIVITLTTKGETLSYQWLKNGIELPGANQVTYRKTNVTLADSGVYSVRVWNACDTITSANSIVKVAPKSGPGQLTVSSETIALGEWAACAAVDTTFVNLVANAGGSPITITAVTTNASSIVELVGVSVPFTLAPGAGRDIAVIVRPGQLGNQTGAITFTTASATAEVDVTVTGTSALSTTTDTLTFAASTSGVEKCAMVSVDAACEELTITSVEITGAGASSYALKPGTTFPFVVPSGSPNELCFVTTAADGGPATAMITSASGTVSVVLRRDVTNSVDDVTNNGFAVYPNPATTELRVARTELVTSVVLHDATGRSVVSFDPAGRPEVFIDCASFARGVYILSVVTPAGVRHEKVILH